MPTTAKKEPKKSTEATTGVISTGKTTIPELVKQIEEEKQKTIEKTTEKIIVHQKKSDRVAICGFAPTSKDLAPYADKSVEIWGCNELYEHIPRVDVIFELHDRSEFESTFRNQRHLDWLKAANIPIYMVKHYDDIPNSIPYPLHVMTSRFGTYFNNTISYMICLAIFMQYKWVGLFGIDMAHSTEYGGQRPSCEYFIGWARGLAEAQGFPTIHVPEESELLKCQFLYGYVNGDKHSKLIQQKIRHYSAQQNRYAMQEMQARDAKNQYIGGVQGFHDFERTMGQYKEEDLISEHKGQGK
jgi:hypothetical protein